MHRTKSVCIVLLLVGILFSCGTPLDPFPPREFRQLTLSESELVASSNSFGLHLLRMLNAGEHGTNVFISPLSVSLALGMTMNGAAGETFIALRATLGFEEMDESAINESYRGLIQLLYSLDPVVTIQIANSIWYMEGFPVKESFLETNNRYFDASVNAINFSHPDVSKTINTWVNDKTRGKIKEIVPDAIPDDIVLYLINAIYFKGDWKYQFDKKNTLSVPFRLLDGSSKSVQMMSGKAPIRYVFTDEYTVAELPYGDGYYNMTIILPAGFDRIESFVESLSETTWNTIIGSLPESGSEIDIRIPKFKLEYAKELNEVLKALGMEVAFERGRADFTGMYNKEQTSGENLFISTVDHKAVIEVNEEGSTAAAATSVGMGRTSVKPEIIVDRPFVFAIRENYTGTIVFIGTCVEP
jgi:serine protease inhibitor